MITLNNKKPLILAVVAVVAFALFMSPTLAVSDVLAKEKKNKGNDSDQDIEQGQDNDQNAQCVSGEDVAASCNQLSFKDQDNEGNNAAGQQNGKGKGNDGDQDIDQDQDNKQNSQCVAGDSIAASCNQLSFQDQDNEGNNAAGQQNGKGKGNDGDQEIDQDQDNKQNTQCVAGDSIAASCNQLSFQDQDNEGNNAAAQDGGDGKKGNDGDQDIEQDQDNDQNAQCVSGEDAIVSCNNLSFQDQFNSGKNALGQN